MRSLSVGLSGLAALRYGRLVLAMTLAVKSRFASSLARRSR